MNTGPEDSANILRFMDWRFSQLWQGMNMNAANIFNMVDEKFTSLQQTLRRFAEEIGDLKDQVQQDREELQDLQEEKETILHRLEKLEQRQESTEMDTKRCNLKFFGIPEHRRGLYYSCAEQIVDVLNEYSRGRTWELNDVKHAFRVGNFRQSRDDPRPVVAQFSLWADKMSVLTDKQLRDELRRDGIRVTTDPTSRQREMIEFYRNQGQNVYFRNGRLYFATSFQQAQTELHSYDEHDPGHYRNTDTGGEQTLNNEDWPYLSRSQKNRRETGYGQWHRQNRSDDPRRTNRSDPLIDQNHHVTDGNTRGRHQRRPLRGVWNKDGNKHGPSGQYGSPYSLDKNPVGDLDGGRQITPGHRSYSEVVHSRPRPSRDDRQLYARPPSKTGGEDDRPHPQYSRAVDRPSRLPSKQVQNWTNDNCHTVTTDKTGLVQTENITEYDQQDTNTADIVTEDDHHLQNSDDHSSVNNDLFVANDLAGEMGDCNTDTRDDTLDKNGQLTHACNDTDNEGDYERQDESRQDEMNDKADVTPEAPPTNVQLNDSHCNDDDSGAEIVHSCEQSTQSLKDTETVPSNHTNSQGLSPCTGPNKTHDRLTRSKQTAPKVQTRRTDGTPQTGRSSSQSSIVDSLRRMGSKERCRDGKQETRGTAKTRSKSAQSK